MKTHKLGNPEHDFSVSREQWEEAVFNNAAYFSVVRLPDRARQDHRTYPSAVIAALSLGQKTRRLIYAVTETGRYVVVPDTMRVRCIGLWSARVEALASAAIDAAAVQTEDSAYTVAYDALITFGLPDVEAHTSATVARAVFARRKREGRVARREEKEDPNPRRC